MRDHRKDYRALTEAGEISAKDAAAMLGISTNTLKKLRDKGEGPAWRQVHKRLVAYKLADVTAAGDSLKVSTRKAKAPAVVAYAHPVADISPDPLA